MQPRITDATADDCEKVAAFAAQAFSDTFGHLYTPENLQHHLMHKNSAGFFRDSLGAGDTLLMMHEGDTLVGYAKVGTVALPIKKPIPKGAQEIHRVYVGKAHQGRGLGKVLMLNILSLPRITTAPTVFLGVWEENLRAQHLYTLYGFEQAGKYLYQVGDQFDNEIIMARKKAA